MDSITEKWCNRCKEWKSPNEFHKGHHWCKECRREEKRLYTEKNKDKVQQQHKRYNEANKEKINFKNWLRRALNPEKTKEQRKQWKKNEKPQTPTPEKKKEWQRRYIENNKEKRSESVRKYVRTHRDKVNSFARNRKALLRGGTGTLSNNDWQEVLDMYGHKCLCCGSTEDLTRDHVIPVSKGGSNTKENVQPLCALCNSRKHTKVIDYR